LEIVSTSDSGDMYYRLQKYQELKKKAEFNVMVKGLAIWPSRNHIDVSPL